MTLTVVQRATELDELRLAWAETQTRYIHVWGVPGAGKTTIVRQILSESETPIIDFQCRFAMQLDLRSMMGRLEAALLTPDQIETLHKKKQKALVDAGYRQAPRTHSISLAENAKIFARGNVVVGDNIHKSDAQYDRELLEECRLHLELLGALLGPCAKPVCTVFLDSLEAVDEADNQLCQWLSVHCLETNGDALIPIRVIATSRLRSGLKSHPEARRVVQVGAMSENEATSLLQCHGVSERNIREWLVSITRAHPQALVLASRLPGVMDMDDLELPSQSSAVYEELCTEILLRSVLKHEPDGLVRRAMITVPILRFFTAGEISTLLQCSADETQHIITALKSGGFLEVIGKTLKYHDLLRDLTLKFIQASRGDQELRALHMKAASAFEHKPEDTELMTVVEPFYHLLNGDLGKAVEYSERHIKPALDRKERTLAAVLINQIDLASLPDTTAKGWLLLRYGGYYREFRDFPKAVEILERIPPMVGTDERLLASVLNNLGWVYLYWVGSDHIKRALEFFEKSNTICRKHGYIDILAMNLNNIGIVHSRLRGSDGQKELECYEQCLAITESDESRNYLVSGMALQNAGLVYKKRRDYERALGALTQALGRFRACRCPQREGEMVYLIACVLLDSKEYGKSRDFLDFSLRAMQSRSECDPYYLAENFFALARVLERLGEHENMRQCLVSGVAISLMENIQYHIVAAQKTAHFCRYLFAAYGRDFALETLEYIVKHWSDSDLGATIPQFSDFLLSEGDNMRRQWFWANGQSHVSHLPASKACKPRRWDRVVLRATGGDRVCKRCEAVVLAATEAPNNGMLTDGNSAALHSHR